MAVAVNDPPALDKAEFHQKGFTVMKSLFDPFTVKSFQEEADRIQTLLADQVENVRTELVSTLFDTKKLGRIDPIVDVSPLFSSLEQSDKLRLIAKSLLQTDRICLYRDKLIFCPPGSIGYQLHADYAWWDERAPDQYCTFAIFLDGCSMDSGPVEYFAGSHKARIPQMPRKNIAAQDAHLLEGFDSLLSITEPGDVIVFHSQCVHCSYPNMSASSRRVLYLTYCNEKEDMVYEKHLSELLAQKMHKVRFTPKPQ